MPDLRALSPHSLSLAELALLHKKLGDWLVMAESVSMTSAPAESEVEAVRETLRAITSERRERQADERRDS